MDRMLVTARGSSNRLSPPTHSSRAIAMRVRTQMKFERERPTSSFIKGIM